MEFERLQVRAYALRRGHAGQARHQPEVLCDLVEAGRVGHDVAQERFDLGHAVADATWNTGERSQPCAPPVVEAQDHGRVEWLRTQPARAIAQLTVRRNER